MVVKSAPETLRVDDPPESTMFDADVGQAVGAKE
jgi:hypothetical protein